MRILLATDGSEYSEAAVDEIAQRPFPKGSAKDGQDALGHAQKI
jgi:hypothetical protein